MTGRIVSVLMVGWLIAGVGAQQSRPIFTGTWKFIGEKSTPSDKSALGEEFRITQEANALVLEVPLMHYIKTQDKTAKGVFKGLGAPMVYKMDGNEHSLPVNPFVSSDETSFTMNYIIGGPYRISWSGSTLIIAGVVEIPHTSFTGGATLRIVPHRLTTSFSLNRDGTLLVERTNEQIPADKGQAEPVKAVFKSVYRKTS